MVLLHADDNFYFVENSPRDQATRRESPDLFSSDNITPGRGVRRQLPRAESAEVSLFVNKPKQDSFDSRDDTSSIKR